MPNDRSKNASRARRMPTAIAVVAVLLAISVAAFAYASSGGTKAPPPCHRVEAGVSNCLANNSLARTTHRKIGVAHSVADPLRRVRGRARSIGVPTDCNGVCPAAKQRELAEAAAAAEAEEAAVAAAGATQRGKSTPGKAEEEIVVAPAAEAPKEAPAAEAPKEGPATEAPATEAPATEAPPAEAPQEDPAAEAPRGEAEAPQGGGDTPQEENGGGGDQEGGGTPPAEPSCGLGVAATISMYSTACPLFASDLASVQNPLSFWGSIQCAEESRYAYVQGDGDQHLSATGETLDGNYRRLTVLDGDNYSGERCELGENSTSGPTAFYHEGENVLTYFSERLPSNFPLDTEHWQVTMQMKQAQPSHDDGSGVALEMEARSGRWIVSDLWHEEFSFPAEKGIWTRFAWNVYYSKDPSKGWVQVSVDLNGDGDFDDPGEKSPVIHAATLATELPEYAAEDGIPANSGIPSHLRMGIYHDEAIPCPAPSGCSVDVDNVQIVRPAS
jgi:Polysaccharide lyase